LDWIASAIGLLGTVEVGSGLALGLTVARWRSRQRDALAPLLMFVAVAFEVLLKLMFPHPPPPHDSQRSVAIVSTVTVAFANSFPSGHVLRSAFLLAIAHRVPTWATTAALGLMMASRVYLAEHWLSDCVGGLVVGLLAAGLAYAMFGRRDETPTWTRGRAGGPSRR